MSVWASSNQTTDIRHGATAPEPRGEHDVTQNRTYRRRGCGTWRGCIGPHLSVRSRLASWLARRMASRMGRTARRRPRPGLWLRRLLCAPHGADAMGPTLASRQPLLLNVEYGSLIPKPRLRPGFLHSYFVHQRDWFPLFDPSSACRFDTNCAYRGNNLPPRDLISCHLWCGTWTQECPTESLKALTTSIWRPADQFAERSANACAPTRFRMNPICHLGSSCYWTNCAHRTETPEGSLRAERFPALN